MKKKIVSAAKTKAALDRAYTRTKIRRLLVRYDSVATTPYEHLISFVTKRYRRTTRFGFGARGEERIDFAFFIFPANTFSGSV